MDKQTFLAQLRNGLSGLPQDEIEERLTFYNDMIDDRIEDGILEADAVEEFGPVNDLVAQIIEDIPLSKLVREKIRPKRKMKAWETVLLILGSPLWLPLLLACTAVILAIYVCLWAVIASLWAVFVAVAACAIAGVAGGILMVIRGEGLNALAWVGAGLVCAGLSVLLFYGCKAATKGILQLTKKLACGIKHCFVRKEEA